MAIYDLDIDIFNHLESSVIRESALVVWYMYMTLRVKGHSEIKSLYTAERYHNKHCKEGKEVEEEIIDDIVEEVIKAKTL